MFDRYLQDASSAQQKVYSLHVRPTDKGRWVVIGFYGGLDRAQKGTLSKTVKVYYTAHEAKNAAWDIEADKRRKGYDDVDVWLIWPCGSHPYHAPVVPDSIAGLPQAPPKAQAPYTRPTRPTPTYICPICQQASTNPACASCGPTAACINCNKVGPTRNGPMQQRMIGVANGWQCPTCYAAAKPPLVPCRNCGNINVPNIGLALCSACRNTVERGRVPQPPAPAAIPPWLVACLAEIPALGRAQAADILGQTLPDLVPVIALAVAEFEKAKAKAPTPTSPRPPANGQMGYRVDGLQIGIQIGVSDGGRTRFVINGKITATDAAILNASGQPTTPHSWVPKSKAAPPPPPAPAPIVDPNVNWMRVLFSKTPRDARKQLYRLFTKVVHEDINGNTALHQRWIETYERFA